MERLRLFPRFRQKRSLFFATGAVILLLLDAVSARRPYAQEHSLTQDLTQLQADDGQWIMPAKNYASTRYSGLDQITADNVKHLQPAWTFSTGVLRGHEAAPLVVNKTMYIVTPYPNILYVLDLTRPGAPMKWSYKPKPSAAAQGVACCDVVNRGAAYAKGKIVYNTPDNYTIAVDANSGEEVWKTRLGDINRSESMRCSGSTTSRPASSHSRSPIALLMGSSVSPSCPASAGGLVRSSLAISIRRTVPLRWASSRQ